MSGDGSLGAAGFFAGALDPYLLLILAGFLPSEVFRVLGVFIGRSLPADSPILAWVRLVATALLTAVVAKILMSPSGALAAVPLPGRMAGIAGGFLAFFLFGRSVFAGVLVGEALVIVAAGWANGW
jgi:branched-subunit amino acid transport protein